MKRIIAFVLCLMLCVSMLTVFASARDVTHENDVAKDLKALNLFKGVSETNFDLNRAPTRVEALVMLIRVLGKEKEALSRNWSHPFKDVPQWADKYVGYAYSKELTNGISATEFGSGNASSAMYLTFVLRALGHSDTNGKDFTWDNPYELAVSCGILPAGVDVENFLRADVVLISHAALACLVNGEHLVTLSEKLIREGVFTSEQYRTHYDRFKHKAPAGKYDAFNALRTFVLVNGQFIESAIEGINTDSYVVHFVHEENGTEFNIEYILSTAALRITHKRYHSRENYFDISVLLTSQDALNQRMFVSCSLVDDGGNMSGAGYFDPKTFKESTPITLSWWADQQYSTYYTKIDCEKTTRITIADMLDILQSISDTFDLSFSVADLGFESIF